MINDKNFESVSKGILVPLPKSDKSKTVKNTRPIILLKITRKILSIITLNRMKPDVEQFLSPSQAGFRRGRSTIDIVWAEKLFVKNVWPIAKQLISPESIYHRHMIL